MTTTALPRRLTDAPNDAALSGEREEAARALVRRRGVVLNSITIGYNVIEAVLALLLGGLAGSIALVGFGIDSVIEVSASLAARWRLQADLSPAKRAHAERRTLQLVGWSFLALAAYVAWEVWRRSCSRRCRVRRGGAPRSRRSLWS
jgi:divalent metal cation (Fe/Co/Zn/Cd) transporter